MKCPNCGTAFKWKTAGNIHFRSREGVLCGRQLHPIDGRTVDRVSQVSCAKCLAIVEARVTKHAKALEDLVALQTGEAERVMSELTCDDGDAKTGG